jgi:hypothetical protein
VLGTSGPDLIEPDVPTVIAPPDQATGIAPADLGFSFTSQYTPSGQYKVQLAGLLPGGTKEATINGNAGGETNFGLPVFGLSDSDLQPEMSYQWRARASDIEPAVDASYHWGPTWWFTTAPAPPHLVVFEEAHCAELPEIFAQFIPVAGATQYDFEYQEVPVGTPDTDQPSWTGDKMAKTWQKDDLQEQTSTYETLTGVTLPNGQAAVPLPGTVCDQANVAYRVRARLCKSANCSKFTGWWLYWDVTP